MQENVLTTPTFRVSYPAVVKAKLNKLNGKEEYSLVALYEKGADLSIFNKAIEAAVMKKFGKDKAQWPKNLKMPFRDQSDRGKRTESGAVILPDGYVEGAKYCNLKNTQRPGVVDQKRNPILDETEFYAGCYARAIVSVFAYDAMGNKGVSLSLLAVQKVRDGQPFGNRVNAESAFSAISDDDAGGPAATTEYNFLG